MLTGEVRNQVDQIWNAFWSGGVSNPLSVIEQITYLLFIKRLDDLHTLEENKAANLGIAMERRIFPERNDDQGRAYADLRWSRFENFEAREMMDVVAERVFPFLRALGEEGSSYGQHMKDARLGFSNAALLAKTVDMLDKIPMEDRDTKGDQTTRVNEMWQTDFTYFKIIGWGWMYLSTVLDDYSRYIIAWKLCSTMRAEDVTDTLDMALAASGCDQAHVHHRPRLLSDNGPSYIAGELAEYIEAQRMSHVRGAPFHPQTQGKIERWHQTLKNRILLENYFLPDDLEAQIEAFVEHYNHQLYHESLSNVTPAYAYFGRADAIIKQRERIKRKTIEHRRLQHRKLAA